MTSGDRGPAAAGYKSGRRQLRVPAQNRKKKSSSFVTSEPPHPHQLARIRRTDCLSHPGAPQSHQLHGTSVREACATALEIESRGTRCSSRGRGTGHTCGRTRTPGSRSRLQLVRRRRRPDPEQSTRTTADRPRHDRRCWSRSRISGRSSSSDGIGRAAGKTRTWSTQRIQNEAKAHPEPREEGRWPATTWPESWPSAKGGPKRPSRVEEIQPTIRERS